MKMFDTPADLATRPGKVDSEEAKREEILVPIRLEFEVEHHRMREAFVWNLNGGYFVLAFTLFVC
jgi:SNF5/SMARCB1/INI1 like protein